MGQPDTPDSPDPVQTYRQGIEIYLASLPRQLRAEAEARMQYDPERVAQQQGLQEFFGPTQYRQQLDALHQLDPESAVIRRQLAGNVSQDLAGGYQLPEQYSQELDTNFRGAQAARGNSLGTSAGAAETAFKGKAALDLYQQHLSNAGNFLSGPTPVQQISLIQGVSPDRSSAYTNPGAGYAGQQFALNNYQNLLAQQQLSGAGRNPWAGALSGAASGAQAGGSTGSGWGALIGGVVGGTAGYFCDSRLKENIVEVGTSPSGIPIIRFNYLGYNGTLEAARAEDVAKVFPDAVKLHESGYLTVDFSKTDVEFKHL